MPPPPWVRPPAPPARPPGYPLPPRHIYPGPPYLFRLPPRGVLPRFAAPPSRPIVDTEQLWLDTFKRTHCCSEATPYSLPRERKEPPLRLLRRRIVEAQKLVDQLKVAATELAAVEKKLETCNKDVVHQVEATRLRLRVQRERKLAVCEKLKKQLEAMNATSGLFSRQQFTEIREFASRVHKKKAYRKRAKLRRRAEASAQRALDLNIGKEAQSTGRGKEVLQNSEDNQPPVEMGAHLSSGHIGTAACEQQTSSHLSTNERSSSTKSLAPEALTLDALIAIRRAWDAFLVFPHTPGASTIPPHFVPPPPTPSNQWAIYVVPTKASQH